MKPAVSIIVPTYNRAEFLRRALRSIEEQTYRDYEVIVVNDGGDPVCGLVNKFENVKLIDHAENRGLPAARNTGIRAARGAYIAFLDDDDVFYPDHLQTLVDVMDKGAMVAYTDAHMWENDREKYDFLSIDYSKKELLNHNLFPVMCAMVRKELFDGCLFDETLNSHEDWDLWIRMSMKVKEFVHIKKKTAAYSKRGGQDQISFRHYHIDAFNKVKQRYAR